MFHNSHQLTTIDHNEPIGTIRRQWNGQNADIACIGYTFTVSFPQHLDATTKASAIAAMLLLNHRYLIKKKINH